jgi:phage terminase large subunit GpA-like protein
VYKPKGRQKFAWEIIPGHERNEPLDCRDYAQAAFIALSPDMDALHRRRNGKPDERDLKPKKPKTQKQRTDPVDRIEQKMNEMMNW